MAPALVGGPLLAPTGAYQTTFTPSWPSGSGRTAGNLLVCWCVTGTVATGSPLPATPAGWTRAGYLTEADTQGGAYLAATAILYYKVAAGGDTAPSFTVGTNVWVGAGLAEFSDAGTTVDQIGSAGGAYVDDSVPSPITPTAPDADANSSELVLYVGALNFSTPAGDVTTADTINNCDSLVGVNTDAQSTWLHRCWGYGVTTADSTADSNSYSYAHTAFLSTLWSAAGLVVSFKWAAYVDTPTLAVVETLGVLDDYEIHQFDDTPTLGIQARMLVEQAYSYAAPTVQTGIASQVTKTSAILAATINAGGEATTWWFEYGTTDLYGQETYRLEAGILDRTRTVQAAVAGLQAGNELPLPDRRGEHQRHQLRR